MYRDLSGEEAGRVDWEERRGGAVCVHDRMDFVKLQRICAGDLRSRVWYLFQEVGAREQACQNQALDKEGGSCMWTKH